MPKYATLYNFTEQGIKAVHAKGGRAMQDGVLSGTAENPDQQINAFIAAAGQQNVIFRN